jgi:dihydroorotase (multifunctional complex type)
MPETQNIVVEGAIGFKLFMNSQIGGLNFDDDQTLEKAFREVATLNTPLAVHAEDKTSLTFNEEKLKQAQKNSIADFLRAHTENVELKAIQRVLEISKQTAIRLHFCHISTKDGLNAISKAKKDGRNVNCEVTPNHLLLSSEDLKSYGQIAIMAPPLRDKTHVEALWKGIETGLVDTIGSDHAPHTLNEKSASSIWDTKVGVPGLETTLPLILTQIKKNRLSLGKAIQLMAEKPAEIFSLNNRGHLQVGKNADLTIVDFNRQFRIDASKFKSKAKFSPYNGLEVWGKLVKTVVNGQVVFDEGEIVSKAGSGSIVRRGSYL